jgi:hypothetical protein
MAPRADSLADLRALDRQLAEVAPGPHLERRILGQLRGEVLPARGRGLERARRPALVLSFALVAAMAVLLGIEARDGDPPSAAGPSAPEARDLKEAAPADDAVEPIAPAGPARQDIERRPPRAVEEGDESQRRGAPNEMRPDFRERARPKAPRFFEAPDAPESPRSFVVPGAPEGGPPARPKSTPRGISPTGGYGSMLYSQGARPDGLEPRSIRLFGPRRSSPSASVDADAPVSTGSGAGIDKPPAIPWEAPEEAPSMCESPSTWKSLANAECEAEGLVLIDLKLLEPCGDEMFSGVEAVCAAPVNAPAGDPPPGYCTGIAVGDGTTCEPPEYWKLLADKTCSADGLFLVEIHPSQDCSDGLSTMAKVLCCDDVAPPDANPAPSPCVTFEMSPACSPADEVKGEAKAQCESKGLSFTDMKLIPGCPNGGVSYAAVLCCP